MRILINLRASKDQSYYHHKLQGFVYGLLRNSGFGGLHDKRVTNSFVSPISSL